MPSLRIKLFILGACAIAASMAVTATSRAQQSPENKAGSCVWKTLDSEAMLNQRIGRVDVANASLVRDFVPLLLKRGVPLSFIEADKDSRVTLSIGDPTLREVLEGIVSQSPGYRFLFVSGHLVLFPRTSPYDLPLTGFGLPRLSRLTAADRLVSELSRRCPVLAKLKPPLIVGDVHSLLYSDPVTVSGAANALEGLVMLLGERQSAVFEVRRTRWHGEEPAPGVSYLDLNFVEIVKSIEVKPLITSLRVGETMQLKVVAALAGGGSQDVTSAVCGTTYEVTSPRVATVGEDGLVRALAPGEEQIVVQSEAQQSSLSFRVSAERAAPGASRSAPAMGPP